MIPHCMDDFARRAQAQLEMQRMPIAGEHEWPSVKAWAIMGVALGALLVWGICS